MLTFFYRPICYFFMMHTQRVIVRVKGQPRLLFCIRLSVLKVTSINRWDGFVKHGWQQRELNDKGPGLLAFVTPVPLPLSRQQLVSLSQPSCVSPVELTERRRGRAWRRIIWPQKSLALYKSFNTLWLAGCRLCCMCCRLFRSLELPIKMIS